MRHELKSFRKDLANFTLLNDRKIVSIRDTACIVVDITFAAILEASRSSEGQEIKYLGWSVGTLSFVACPGPHVLFSAGLRSQANEVQLFRLLWKRSWNAHRHKADSSKQSHKIKSSYCSLICWHSCEAIRRQQIHCVFAEISISGAIDLLGELNRGRLCSRGKMLWRRAGRALGPGAVVTNAKWGWCHFPKKV